MLVFFIVLIALVVLLIVLRAPEGGPEVILHTFAHFYKEAFARGKYKT